MTHLAQYSPEDFIARYALFSSINTANLKGYFVQAELLLSLRTCTISNDARRKELLYLIVAHLCTMHTQSEALGGQTGGRLATAHQGSVSIGFQPLQVGSREQWWALSTYGHNFWQLTKGRRKAKYLLPKIR